MSIQDAIDIQPPFRSNECQCRPGIDECHMVGPKLTLDEAISDLAELLDIHHDSVIGTGEAHGDAVVMRNRMTQIRLRLADERAELAQLRATAALVLRYGEAVEAVHETRARVVSTQEEEDAAQADYRSAADTVDATRLDLFMHAHKLATTNALTLAATSAKESP